ncbi:MAG TPA: Crp/Fnr family transcriptional regulator [Patescibacteria group bacterium]|nr:Crp/Fnr family transcriptional regulator [Patescibacteria group bacterium]
MAKNFLQTFFIENGTKEIVAKGEMIIRIEKSPQSIFFIEKGHVGAYIGQENQLQAIYRKGDMFPFSHHVMYSSVYYAMTETILRILPSKRLYNLVEKDNRIARDLVHVLIERADLLKDRLTIVTTRTTYFRVIQWILFAGMHFGKQKRKVLEISLIATQQELANALATTRETINRIFSKLEKKGLIRTDQEVLRIPSIKNLQKEISS